MFDYCNKGKLRTKYTNMYDNYDTEGNWLRRIRVTLKLERQTLKVI